MLLDNHSTEAVFYKRNTLKKILTYI